QQKAILSIEEGEEIVEALISSHIAGTGHYKFLAKRRKDKKIEWAHFVERADGTKDSIYRGEVRDEKELKIVIEIMNRNLTKCFGTSAEMKEGKHKLISLFGTEGGTD